MYYCLKPGRIRALYDKKSYGKLARRIDAATGELRTTRATMWHWNHAGVKYLHDDDMPRMRALATILDVELTDLLDEREPTERERSAAIAEARRRQEPEER